MTPAWRDKSYYKRKFNKLVIQIKKVVPKSNAKCSAFWTRTTDKQAITFTDEDAKKVQHPHDDAIVIISLIADYTTRKVLVDNGSSTNILYYPTFQQMRLG